MKTLLLLGLTSLVMTTAASAQSTVPPWICAKGAMCAPIATPRPILPPRFYCPPKAICTLRAPAKRT
jgi:hypothetical protein